MGELIGFTTMPRDGRPRPSGRPLRPEPDRLWREAVGEQLRAERRRAGRRLVDVADDAGVSPQYLSELERGLKDPSSELLAAVAGALGLGVMDLAARVIAALPAAVDLSSQRGSASGAAGTSLRAGSGPLCLAA